MALFLKGKYWYIDYYAKGRRLRECSYVTNKHQAEVFLCKRRTEVAENRFLDKRKDQKILFDDYIKIYLQKKLNRKSYKIMKYRINKTNKYFPNMYLYQIGSKDIEKYRDKRIKEVGEITVNRDLALLKNIFTEAIKDKIVYENPVKGIEFFNEEKYRRERFLTPVEIRELVKACSDFLQPIVVIAITTGMRQSEILGLRWKDINFNTGFIHLSDSKSGDGRDIPMNKILTAILKNDSIISLRNNPNNYLFRDNNGRLYHDVNGEFERVVKKLGFNNNVVEKKDKLVFHSLRHTFASYIASHGYSLLVLKKLLGHKTLRMVERYSHLNDSILKSAVDSLSMDTIWTPEVKQKKKKKHSGFEIAN